MAAQYMNRDVLLAEEQKQDNDETWKKLYSLLLPKAKVWAYNSGILIWRGQENDVAWDIVLTSVARTFEYTKQATERGIVILSLEYLSIKIATNYYRDLKRRERRLQHFSQEDGSSPYEHLLLDHLRDPSEEASDKVYEEWLLAHAAKTISFFSKKLRAAILIDLANRMHFSSEPTALQQAFLAMGIHLREYQKAESTDPRERSRQAALRSLAYKRMAQTILDLDLSINRRKKCKKS